MPGKNIQTQLLAYYNSIYNTLMEGKRMDTVFLDFAKAFNKVNHRILLKKVVNQNKEGKRRRWIKEFLRENS